MCGRVAQAKNPTGYGLPEVEFTMSRMPMFSVRLVVRDRTGEASVVLRKWGLRARSLPGAKIEADRGIWQNPIRGNALEIVDAAGNVVACRSYLGRDVYVPWI